MEAKVKNGARIHSNQGAPYPMSSCDFILFLFLSVSSFSPRRARASLEERREREREGRGLTAGEPPPAPPLLPQPGGGCGIRASEER